MERKDITVTDDAVGIARASYEAYGAKDHTTITPSVSCSPLVSLICRPTFPA